jgi:hypothetical protein
MSGITLRRRLTLDDAISVAAKHGGRCLSPSMQTGKERLIWKCAKGHAWKATLSSVRTNLTWCKKCARERIAAAQRRPIEESQKIALARGGALISKDYINNQQKLIWRCMAGHEFQAKALHVSRGVWCNICSSGLGERICREFFEQLFSMKFPKVRPPWLTNADGNQMELDGYSAQLKLAFEHQGRQHYQENTHFIRGSEKLKKRISDDKRKKVLCKARGILLVQVPEIPSHLKVENVRNFIGNKLQEAGKKLKRDFFTRAINLGSSYKIDLLRELKELGLKKGGECLSEAYVGVMSKYKWRCKNGHEWTTAAANIKAGQWCPRCAKNAPLLMEDIQRIAKDRGGKCLSKNYTTGKPLEWQCKKRHRWLAEIGSIKQANAWCPICAGNAPISIDECRSLAKCRGGACVSTFRKSKDKFIFWKCSEGHQFRLEPTKVRNGKWCPRCAYKRRGVESRVSIQEMHRVAKSKGGQCLSSTYLGNKKNLKWRCAKGHEWLASPGNVKNKGTWCMKCRKRESAKRRAQ